MLTRRDALIGVAAVMGTIGRRAATVTATAAQPSTPVRFPVPTGACDCHAHVFGDPLRFPMSPSRTYTPEPAVVSEMQAMHRTLHLGRVVIVQPSVYGTDNSCTLDAVAQHGASARAIAVIDENTPASALDGMQRRGVRGIRVNLATVGQSDPAVGRQRFQSAVERVHDRGWHVQVFTELAVIAALAEQVVRGGVPVVFDHFGGAKAALGMAQPGFDVLLDLVRTGHAYVKISAPYRSSALAPDYPDVAPLAKALIAANPQRILWGSDWPHPDSMPSAGRKVTDIAKFYQIDDGRVLNQLAVWAPDAAVRALILVENPRRLYGF